MPGKDSKTSRRKVSPPSILHLDAARGLPRIGGRDPFAPVLLIPVNIKYKGHDLASAELEIAGDPEIDIDKFGALMKETSRVFIDPDGHPWEVAHNEAWTIAADGSVHLPR